MSSSTQSSCASEWTEAPQGFSCTSYAHAPSATRVALRGELDLAAAPQLSEELCEAARRSALVILDLSGLTFMDSSGLQVILSAHARLAEADRRLMLVPGGRQVQRIFEITGTEHHLEFTSAPDAVLSGKS